LQAKLDGTDLGQSTEQIAKQRPLDGVLGGTLQLHGAGTDWPTIRTNVAGQGAVVVQHATLGADLQSRFVSAFEQGLQGLQALQSGKALGDLPKSNQTQLGDLHANFAVQDGWLRLTSPIDAQTPFGALHVDGRIGLDRNLDLSGTVQITPQFVQTLSLGRLVPHAPITVPVAVKGTASDPQFQVTMSPEEVTKLLVAAGALPGIGNIQPGIGGGPLPHVPAIPSAIPTVPTIPSGSAAPGVPHLPPLPVLPQIPGVNVPPTPDAGAPH
jgi:AsmA protein